MCFSSPLSSFLPSPPPALSPPPAQVFSFGILMQQMANRMKPYSFLDGGVVVNKLFWQPVTGAPPAYVNLRRRCGARCSAD